jgi:hypothetical protein
MDKFQDLRTEMMLVLESLGIDVECQHHEVATAGQAEIDMRFKPLLQMGDQLMWFKYVLKNVAARNGHTVTFMPKPLFEDNGTGMHTHISIWKDGNPLFAGDKYAGVSQEALWAIGGILKHCKALCAFTNPTTNSYKRLVPGFEAPVNLAYSSRNRSAAVRIPMYSSPKAKRIEFRTPDPSCNGYLAFSAMLMAVLDGIENKIDPGDPLDKNIYDLPPEELAEIESAPGLPRRSPGRPEGRSRLPAQRAMSSPRMSSTCGSTTNRLQVDRPNVNRPVLFCLWQKPKTRSTRRAAALHPASPRVLPLLRHLMPSASVYISAAAATAEGASMRAPAGRFRGWAIRPQCMSCRNIFPCLARTASVMSLHPSTWVVENIPGMRG